MAPLLASLPGSLFWLNVGALSVFWPPGHYDYLLCHRSFAPGDFDNFCGYQRDFLGRGYSICDSDFGLTSAWLILVRFVGILRLCLSLRYASWSSIASTRFNKSGVSLSVWICEINLALCSDIG